MPSMPTTRLPVALHRYRLWGGLETTFGQGPGAAAGPVAGDAFRALALEAAQLQARRVIPDAGLTGKAAPLAPTRGAYDPLQLRVDLQLRGSGAAGTPPEWAFLLKAAAFEETVGASCVYEMGEEATESAWIWLVSEDGREGILYAGIGFGNLELADLGADAAKVMLSGMGCFASTVGRCLVGTGGITDVATSLPLAAGHGWQITPGCPAFIRVTEGANSEVMKVTALDQSVDPDVATVTRNILGAGAFAFTAAAVITPYIPGRTEDATAQIGEHLGSFTIDEGGGAQAFRGVKHSLAIATGVLPWDKEAFVDGRAGLVKERLGDDALRWTTDVVFTVGSEGAIRAHGWRELGTDLALALTVGNAAGNRVRITAPDAQVLEANAPLNPAGTQKGTLVLGLYDRTSHGHPVRIEFD